MKTSQQVAGIVAAACLIGTAWAQKPTSTTGTSAPGTPSTAARRARVATPPTRIVVRDVSGSPLEGVHIAITGAGRPTLVTDAEGLASIALADGPYRLRFEREGFITLERDVAIRNLRPAEIAAAMNRAPLRPAPPPAPVEPAPPPAPSLGPAGPPVSVSIPAFLDKNFIGRDPLKESVLGCMPDATARLLQLREAMAPHTHADFDEVLYVVAGDGMIRIGDDAITVAPGSMSAIPRGTRHSMERRGKNPLIVLSTLAGSPCPTTSTRAGTK